MCGIGSRRNERSRCDSGQGLIWSGRDSSLAEDGGILCPREVHPSVSRLSRWRASVGGMRRHHAFGSRGAAESDTLCGPQSSGSLNVEVA